MQTGEVKNSDKISEGRKRSLQNLKPHTFKPGKSGNPKGHPKGQRNFATLYRLAIEKLAKMKNVTPEQFEVDLISSGVARAGSDFRFYKDAIDRIHGAPKQAVDVTSGGEKIEGFNFLPPPDEKK